MVEPQFTKRLVLSLMDKASFDSLTKCADDFERWSNYELRASEGMPDHSEWVVRHNAHKEAIEFMRTCAEMQKNVVREG